MRLAGHTNTMEKDRNVVVVGAGVFGLTTALELTLQGYRNVIVLDRHVPPVRFEEKGGRSLPSQTLLTRSSNRSPTAPAWTSHVSFDSTMRTTST